jgi:hypothetical protein
MANQFEYTIDGIDGKVIRSLDEYKKDMLMDYCDKDVALAVCMASIPRLGENSPLYQLDAEVFTLVAKTCSLGPSVPTEIKEVFQTCEELHMKKASYDPYKYEFYTFDRKIKDNLKLQKKIQQDMMARSVQRKIEDNLELQKKIQQDMMARCVNLQRNLAITIKVLEMYLPKENVSPKHCKQLHEILTEKAWCKKCDSRKYRSLEYREVVWDLKLQGLSKECCVCEAIINY